MSYPKLREIREAIISLVSKPYTTRFPDVSHTPSRQYRGKPIVDESHCVGCEACSNVCPPGAITIRDDLEKGIRIITRDYGRCIFCGQCEEHCITGKGVALSDTIFDMSVFDRNSLVEEQEKELVLCESCNAVITTREHFSFIHQTLGPKAFASILNLNLLNERLQLAAREDITVKVVDHLKRKDMFNFLCPDCLRRTLVKDMV